MLADIQRAGTETKLLRIVYRKLGSGEVSERTVEVYSIRNGTRLFAYDVEKDDGSIRQFLITGILSTEVLDQTYELENQELYDKN